jgi:hypothetical protein
MGIVVLFILNAIKKEVAFLSYASMMLLALATKGDVRLPRLSSRAVRKAEIRQAIRDIRHARKDD